MDEIKFKANGDFLWFNIIMGGKVFISYTLTLWSADDSEEKELFEFTGNNKQTHDDHEKLVNKTDTKEDLKKFNDRIIELGASVNATEAEEQPYSIILEVYQCPSASKMDNTTRLGQVLKNGTISLKDGINPSPIISVQLKAI